MLAGSGSDTPAQLNRRLHMALHLSLADPVVRAAASRLRVSLCRLDELNPKGSGGDVFWPLDVELSETEQLRPLSLAGIDDLWTARDAQQRARREQTHTPPAQPPAPGFPAPGPAAPPLDFPDPAPSGESYAGDSYAR